MEYTEKKLAKDLMPKDEYWSENDFNKILTIEQSALNPNDLSIETENFLEAIGKDEIVLVRVPSSPVMSFEEFKEYCKNIAGIEPEPIVKKRYEGYLIGTRSIVPEMTDEEIKCRECLGTGIVHIHAYTDKLGSHTSDSECPLCNGYGFLYKKSKSQSNP